MRRACFTKIQPKRVLYVISFVVVLLTGMGFSIDAKAADPMGTNITINKDNYDAYFENTGLFSYDKGTGILTIPESIYSGNPADGKITVNGKDYATTKEPDSYYINMNGQKSLVYQGNRYNFKWIRASGQSYMKNNIDLNKSFSFKMHIDVKPGPQGPYGNLGDGLSFSFRTGQPDLMGIGGAGFGIGDLKGVFGFVIDGSLYGRPASDAKHEPTIQMFQTNGTNTDLDGHNNDGPENVNFLGNPNTSLTEKQYTSGNLPIAINWDASTKTMSYELKDSENKNVLASGSQNFGDYIQKFGNYASFAISASNGGTQALTKIQVDEFNYSVVGVVKVNYVLDTNDGKSTQLRAADVQRGSLTGYANISAYPETSSQSSGIDSNQYRLIKIDAPQGYKLSHNMLTLPLSDNGTGNMPFKDVMQDVTLHYQKIDNRVEDRPIKISINYVDDRNNQSIGREETISGKFGETAKLPTNDIAGYTPDKENPATFRIGSLDSEGNQASTITLRYHKIGEETSENPSAVSSSSNNSSGSSSSSSNPSSPNSPSFSNPSSGSAVSQPAQLSSGVDSSSESQINTPSESTSKSTSLRSEVEADLPSYLAQKNMAVYTLKDIYLYKSANFSKRQQLAHYVKKPRVFRPMFVVTGYARSSTGKLRYEVRDVNHLSKTNGKRGYITTQWAYVRPVYYRSQHQTLTVINPRGVNAYRSRNLTNKVRNFKQGSVLHVKRFVTHNLTTRYQLSNGDYITGNRKLIRMGKVKQPKQVTVKRTIQRFRTANLTEQNGSFKKGAKLTIKQYTFSHATSMSQAGVKVYAVEGGYVTASPKYAKVQY